MFRLNVDRSRKNLDGYQYASGWAPPQEHDDPLDLTRDTHPAFLEDTRKANRTSSLFFHNRTQQRDLSRKRRAVSNMKSPNDSNERSNQLAIRLHKRSMQRMHSYPASSSSEMENNQIADGIFNLYFILDLENLYEGSVVSILPEQDWGPSVKATEQTTANTDSANGNNSRNEEPLKQEYNWGPKETTNEPVEKPPAVQNQMDHMMTESNDQMPAPSQEDRNLFLALLDTKRRGKPMFNLNFGIPCAPDPITISVYENDDPLLIVCIIKFLFQSKEIEKQSEKLLHYLEQCFKASKQLLKEKAELEQQGQSNQQQQQHQEEVNKQQQEAERQQQQELQRQQEAQQQQQAAQLQQQQEAQRQQEEAQRQQQQQQQNSFPFQPMNPLPGLKMPPGFNTPILTPPGLPTSLQPQAFVFSPPQSADPMSQFLSGTNEQPEPVPNPEIID